MSVTVEGKLELFKRVLFEHIEKDWSEKKKKLAEELEQKINEERKIYEKQIKAVMEDAEKKAEEKRAAILAAIQEHKEQEITKKKEELFSDLIASLKEWAEEFVKSDGYKEFMAKNINQALDLMEGQNLTLILTHTDLDELTSFIKDKAAQREDNKNLELVGSKEDIRGGFIIEDREKGIMADFSIKTLIDEAKEYMGKLLYEKLDEVLKA